MKRSFLILFIALFSFFGNSQIDTLVLQPGPVCGKDALLHGLNTRRNTNFGLQREILIGSWTFQGVQGDLRELIEFDLTGIPIGATVTSATLALTAWTAATTGNGFHSTAGGSNTAWVRRVTSPWQENTVTWNNAPTTTTVNQVTIPMSTSATQNYFNINVTPIVQTMVNNPASNYGFHFQLKTESYYRKLNFCSSDWTVASTWPKITIIYSIPTSPSYFRDSINLGNDTVVCDTNFMLDAGLLAGKYLWNTGDSTQTINVKGSGIYFVQVDKNCRTYFDTINVTVLQGSDFLGIDTSLCEGDSLKLNATTIGASYLWNNGSVDSSIVVLVSGVYWVRVQANGCVFYDTINVNFDVLPRVNLGRDSLLCSSSLLLDAGNFGSTYLWNNGVVNQTNTANNSGLYWVKVANGGCSISDSIVLSFLDLSFSLGNDTVICENSSLTLNSNILAKGYLWNTGSLSSNILIDSSGLYILTTSDSTCSFTDSIIILVQKLNSTFKGLPVSGCVPLRVNFQDTSIINLGTVTSWNWEFGNGNTSTSQHPPHTYTTPGVFSVKLRVTSSINCFHDTTINNMITVYPKPKADFNIISSPSFVGNNVQFISTSIGATNYSWHVGASLFSTSFNPSNVFSSQGVFAVKLVVINSFGCIDSVIKNVIIRESNVFYAANSFSPNGDLHNQTWQVYSNNNIELFDLKIFSRWGELIFSTNDINEAWDGTYLGENCPIGNYVWSAKIYYFDKTREERFGHINLIR